MCRKNVKNIKFVAIRCVLSSSKCTKKQLVFAEYRPPRRLRCLDLGASILRSLQSKFLATRLIFHNLVAKIIFYCHNLLT